MARDHMNDEAINTKYKGEAVRIFNTEEELKEPTPEPQRGAEYVRQETHNSGIDTPGATTYSQYYGGDMQVTYPLLVIKNMHNSYTKKVLDEYMDTKFQGSQKQPIMIAIRIEKNGKGVVKGWRNSVIDCKFLNLVDTLGLTYDYYISKGNKSPNPKLEFIDQEEFGKIILPDLDDAINYYETEEIEPIDYSDLEQKLEFIEHENQVKETLDNQINNCETEVILPNDIEDVLDQEEITIDNTKEVTEEKDQININSSAIKFGAHN